MSSYSYLKTIELPEIPTPLVDIQEDEAFMEADESYSIPTSLMMDSNMSSALVSLDDLGNYVKARLRKNRELYEIFSLVRPQYVSRMEIIKYQMQDIADRIKKRVEVDIPWFQKQNQCLETIISMYEGTKSDHELERNKEKLREHWHLRAYYIPIIFQAFKKKYTRSRDRNESTEKTLTGVSDSIRSCQEELVKNTKAKSDAEREVTTLKSKYIKARAEYLETHGMIVRLYGEVIYWKNFGRDESHIVLKKINNLAKFILNNNISESSQVLDANKDWFEEFLKICSIYSSAEQQGDKHWNHKYIHFICSRCNIEQKGWPTLVKGNLSPLQCATCYHKTRISIALKKRANRLNNPLRLDRNQDLASIFSILERFV